RLLRRLPGIVRRVATRARRRSGGGDRRQRRRQEHAAEKHRRADAAEGRRHHLRWRADRRSPRLRGGQTRDRVGAGRPPAVSLADGGGKPADRRPIAPSRPVDARSHLRLVPGAGRAAPPARPGAVRRATADGRHHPRLLLCDEISLGLAPIVVRDIYARLPAIVAEGLSLIVVEQDIAQALKAARQVYCLQEGRIALQGPARELTRESISAAYFGV